MLTQNDCDEIRARIDQLVYSEVRRATVDSLESASAWAGVAEGHRAALERILNAHVTYEQERASDRD